MVLRNIGWILSALSLTAAAAGRQSSGVPMVFEPNAGQSDPAVRFIARGRGYTLLLTQGGAVFRSGHGDVRMQLTGASPNAELVGEEPLATRINYLFGAAPSDWSTGVAAFGRVRLRGAYPGIDVIYTSTQGLLEYSFVVAPGADASVVQIEFDGDQGIDFDSSGALSVNAADGLFHHAQPRTVQSRKGRQVEVRTSYVRTGEHRAAFQLEEYDHERELVIDPVVSYSTYLGGSGSDSVTGMAVDPSGNVYVSGWTESTSFPVPGSKLGTTGGVDAFVAKLNPAGSALMYVTYLGGRSEDYALGVAVDASGSAIVTGWTMSTDFPVLAAAQPHLAGPRNAFVAKLNPAGTGLVFGTFLGGNGSDDGNGVTLDTAGNIYVAGDTTSTNFPTLNPAQKQLSGQENAFVTKLNSSGAIVYSTYFGGSATDSATAIAVDTTGNAYIAGGTWSSNLPAVSAFQSTNGGGQDAFVAKLNASGGALLYSTYLGGMGGNSSYPETATGLRVDSNGNAYVVGVTSSSNFPVVGALQGSLNGTSDAFVAKINASGSALVYSTYLGGSSSVDNATAVAVDSAGDAYVVGFTASPDFPVTASIQPTLAGEYDAYVAKLAPAGNSLLMSTYLGGTSMDAAYAVALDSFGGLYVAGQTQSFDFLNVAALETNKLAALSGFVLKMAGLNMVNPVLASPAAGTVLTTSPVTFAWNAVSGAVDYRIDVGTSAGGGDIFSGFTGGATSTQVALSQFLNGQSIYVELYSEFSGTPVVTGTGNQYSFATAVPDFNITATSSQTVVAGGNGVYTVTVATVNGFNGAVTFSVSGLPTGASASFAPTSVTGSGSTTMTVSTAASTSAGTYPLTITAISGNLTHTATPSLTVTAVPDFNITATSSQTVVAGGNGVYTVTVAAVNGFNGAVTFSVSGLPTGASAIFAPTSVTGSGSTTMTVSTAASTLAGTYPLTITAVSGNLTHTATPSLTVTAAPDFNITATSSQTGVAGGNGVYTVTVAAVNGFNGAVTFSVSGLPTGASAIFAPTSVTGSGPTTMTVSTAASTSAGTYPLTITAVSGNLTHTATPSLTVTAAPDFNITATSSQTVVAGGNGVYTVTVTAVNGFNGAVTFSVSGLPTGASASFAPTSVTGSGSTTMTVSAAASPSAGTYPLTITAVSGNLTHTATPSLTVTAAPDFNITASSSQTVVAGGNGVYTVTVAGVNGFNGAVTFSVSGLPTGASASFAPTSVTGSGSTTMTVSAAVSTSAGTYPLTITAVSGNLSHTGSVSLTVIAGSVSVSPASVGLVPGQTQQFNATVTGPTNIAVNWSVSPQVGSISSSGLYMAPASVLSQQAITVKAVSQAIPSLSASAVVTLLIGWPSDLSLTNMNITSGTTTYQATDSITAAGNFTVGGSADVNFVAGNQITLGPGFVAKAGTAGITFSATINPTI